MRILVADSSVTYNKMLTQAAAELDKNAVVTCVTGGGEALEKIKRGDYEIIVIDAEVNGISALLKKITLQIPKAFILVTARPSLENEKLCAEALVNGAVDYLIKPIQSSYNDNYEIIKRKIADIFELLSKSHRNKTEQADCHQVVSKAETSNSRFNPGLVLIAASTGGPPALEKIIPELETCFPVPILVVQHMLLKFTDSLAQNLDQKSHLRVKVAEDGEIVEAGTVYIAPGGAHMKLDNSNTIRLDGSPPINGVRPAADVLFESVATSFDGGGVLVVILTGMGHDGARGLSGLKEGRDCFCITQSEESCVVYGMPRAAVEGGYSDMVLDLEDIPVVIESFNYAKFDK